MEITHFIITGWLQQKMVAIPNAVLAKTQEAGATIHGNIKAVAEILQNNMQAAAAEMVKVATQEAARSAQVQAGQLQNEFTASCTAEIKRVANEARGLAPDWYKTIAWATLGAVSCGLLVAGWAGGTWATKNKLTVELETPAPNTYVFPPSADLRAGDTAIAAIKIVNGQARLIPSGRKVAKAGEEKPAVPQLPKDK